MIYTKRFKQDSEYQTYIQGDDVIKPNVSVCETEHHVHYNPGPPIDKPDRNRYGVITIGNIEPFNYEGGEQTGIALTTNSTNTWALTQKSSWLNVSPNRGTGSTTLTVEADEYTNTDEDREGFFTVRYTMPDARYSTTKYGIIQKHAPDPKTYPLTFVALEDGTFKFSGSTALKTLSYSLDNGETWVALAHDTNTPTVQSGATIMWKGTLTPASSKGIGRFFSSGRFDIKGNFLSILSGDNFSGETSVRSYAFYGLFSGNTNVVNCKSIVLPATDLWQYCYTSMFAGCTNLTTVPTDLLPATSLYDDNHCYEAMFKGCSSLTNVPNLPATTLSAYCYTSMFAGCTSLTTVPSNLLPATNLSSAESCYASMFAGCTSLTTAPELPSTTLGKNCYAGMFSSCTSLTSENLPQLPATNLAYAYNAQSCYASMFAGCTSLTTIPSNYLPATTITNGVYNSMFQGCTNLTSAPNLPATSVGSSAYASMFAGCTSLVQSPVICATTVSDSCCLNMFAGCTSLINVPILPAIKVFYASYRQMFDGCTSLTSIPNNMLPATELGQNCYQGMFARCTGLTTVPSNLLPTTNLSGRTSTSDYGHGYQCYAFMFSGCTSLTNTPELPATMLAYGCYNYMFSGCRSLTTAPALPATSLSGANSCYANMFEYCTSLTTAPALPATTLAPSCYRNMFYNCINLTTASSILPATMLADSCYYNMFCFTKITTAPNLPATTLAGSCYSYMFNGCTNLNYIKCLATDISASNCTSSWVSGVQTTSGRFVKNASMTGWTTGNNGIPANWTVEDAT